MAKAQARGVRFGANKLLTPEQTTALHRRRTQGNLITVLMGDYGLSKTSV